MQHTLLRVLLGHTPTNRLALSNVRTLDPHAIGKNDMRQSEQGRRRFDIYIQYMIDKFWQQTWGQRITAQADLIIQIAKHSNNDLADVCRMTPQSNLAVRDDPAIAQATARLFPAELRPATSFQLLSQNDMLTSC